jgi:hypothetical protein
MSALVRSFWLPFFLGLLLFVAGFAVQKSLFADFLVAYGFLIMMDFAGWIEATLVAGYVYARQYPELDWSTVTKEAYSAPALYVRLVALIGLGAFASVSLAVNHPVMWWVCFTGWIAYVAVVGLIFRNHIVTYVRRFGTPPRDFA